MLISDNVWLAIAFVEKVQILEFIHLVMIDTVNILLHILLYAILLLFSLIVIFDIGISNTKL